MECEEENTKKSNEQERFDKFFKDLENLIPEPDFIFVDDMSTLIANVPPIKVWVRREYLRDFRDGHGDYTPGYWVTCKSLTGRALYFETYLTEYGALYDKLPISAFLAWVMTNFLLVLFLLGIVTIPTAPWILLLISR
jgi:hypothetical protein